jgi:hypothetical protein
VKQANFGVSFSIKQCRNFQIHPTDCLNALLTDLGITRFRLMSYWDEHEKQPSVYDFSALDVQVEQIQKAGGVITLCLGARQPRWPESHWPDWALKLSPDERYDALYTFIATVVNRYKANPAVISWQLENEALNRGFGRSGDFNRSRLVKEFKLVKSLDPSRKVIMSTSNTWGLPLRAPRADMYGFTFYRVQYQNQRYSRSQIPWWWLNLRAFMIKHLCSRPSFIHELQAEPWGPKAIWKMTTAQQNQSMDIKQLKTNLQLAKKTQLYPMDLWGAEWWYWRKTKQGDASMWNAVKQTIAS